MGTPVSTVNLEYPKLPSSSADIPVGLARGGPLRGRRRGQPRGVDPRVRLLELQPSKSPDSRIYTKYQVVNLENSARRYETLSYTWGELRADDQKIIHIGSNPASISSSLFSAIERLRLPRNTRHLWIDILCINQTDLQEKTQQVSIMGKIYSQCAFCHIWLGHLGDVDRLDAEEAMDLIACYAGEKREPGPPWLADHARRDKAIDLINQLVSLSWWHRVWTIQEAILPPNATMYWGPCQISWATSRQAAINMVQSAYPSWMNQFLSGVPGGKLNPFTGYVIGMLNARQDNACELLIRWRHRNATNPLDKVYALIGFRDDLLHGELTSVGACEYTLAPGVLFARVTTDIIHRYGSLEPLIGGRGEIPATAGMPSWATDYVGALPGKPRVFGFWAHEGIWVRRGYAAGSGIEGHAVVVEDHRFLCLAGACVDTIAIVEVRPVETLPYGVGVEENSRSVAEILSSRMESGRQLVREWMAAEPTGVDLPDYEECVEDLEKALKGQLIPDTPSHGAGWALQHEWVTSILLEQAIFITRAGRVGVGPRTVTQPGQEVWALARCKFPFILAPPAQASPGVFFADDEGYRFISDCFVRGVMMGETVKEGSSQGQRNIRIY